MKEISKEAAIELLIRNDIGDIRQELYNSNSPIYLTDILRDGHDGYLNYSLAALENELLNRFDDQYIINNEL